MLIIWTIRAWCLPRNARKTWQCEKCPVIVTGIDLKCIQGEKKQTQEGRNFLSSILIMECDNFFGSTRTVKPPNKKVIQEGKTILALISFVSSINVWSIWHYDPASLLFVCVKEKAWKMENYNVNEAFLENLSLGLSSSLEKLPGVQDVR